MTIATAPNTPHQRHKLGLRHWFLDAFARHIERFLDFTDVHRNTDRRCKRGLGLQLLQQIASLHQSYAVNICLAEQSRSQRCVLRPYGCLFRQVTGRRRQLAGGALQASCY